MALVAATYALRSIRRNSRRTILSILGIGIGCALALVMESLNRGRDELFARMGAYGGTGHLRVVPAEWPARRDPRLRLADGAAALAAARALPGVEAVTVRARAQVLLAMGTHVTALEMVGVDPESEPATFRFVRTIQRGRYLRPDDTGTVVLGKSIADRLLADLDDEILASVVGERGQIESALFRLVGIVESGSDDIDATICQVSLEDLRRLTARARAGEVTVVLADWRTSDAARAALASRLPAGDRVLTWGEISPEFHGHLQQDKAAARVVSLVILLIVTLGVASAQLAAVLERRREFAVLAALGMSGSRMMRVVVLEALALAGGSAAIGMALGLPLVWYLATVGLDFRNYLGQYSFQGVVIDPVIYGDLGVWIVWYVAVVALGATLLASIYPAWFAVRTDPATALRVAQ